MKYESEPPVEAGGGPPDMDADNSDVPKLMTSRTPTQN